MANIIALSKNYVPLLDKVYKLASLTTALNTNDAMARAGRNANEIVIPKLSMQGLGDYSRNDGYVKGDVKLEWETVKFNYDRGRLFQVDYLDNEETFDTAFGMLGAEFMRTKVAPEADAFTFAQIASTTGISKVGTPIALTDGEETIKALIASQNKMDEDEVPSDDRILFITPTLYNDILALDSFKSKQVLNSFSQIIKVPQSRFYTAIELLSGGSSEEDGGFKKATGGADINFLVCHKPAIIKFDKHTASDIIAPELNQSADAYIQKYRKYGLVDVYENKLSGVYLHHKPAV